MGLKSISKDMVGASPWPNSLKHEKSVDSSMVSTSTSSTTISPSISSESESESDEISIPSLEKSESHQFLRLMYCFYSNASNTRCADCRTKVFLDGNHEVFISYYRHPFEENMNTTKQYFEKPKRNNIEKFPLFSFAVFICMDCARAHRTTSITITRIKAVTNKQETWTEDELSFIEKHSGNDKANAVLEKYKSKNFIFDASADNVTYQGREVYVRAKYEALAFVFPGILKGSESIVPLFQSKKKNSKIRKKPLRLIDYFCVIGSNGHLEKLHKNQPRIGPRKFETDILECYPDQSFYPDISFPQHVSKFVFPEGCIPYLSKAKPGFFTFVLTLETGDRLYGAALQIYEENSKQDFINSFEELQLITFYLPKCLTILSHYPLFDTFHSFLLQLHHISYSKNNPYPLEQYIAHFTKEIPLPPLGKTEVVAKLLPQLPSISINRPSKNDLPLIGFSLQPLFSCLSVSNVMVVFSCLLAENRVVLCSKYYTLLTPICEALLGLLFPFVWQGCYIPILPYNMLDILDAPFPFLVGVHSRYLRENPCKPQGPIFVDLDDDIVHLGYDNENVDGIDMVCGKRTPSIPQKDAEKLMRVLMENADSMYIPTLSLEKGRITYGSFEHMKNDDRETYARQQMVDSDVVDRQRDCVLPQVQLAYNQQVVSMHNFGMKHDHSVIVKGDWLLIKSLENDPSLTKLKPNEGINLYNRADDEMTNFSGKQIRLGFLRFFVSILLNYKKYIHESTNDFDKEGFLSGLNVSDSDQYQFVSTMISTQMFERFIEESIINPNKPEIRYFNESIIAKKNRSRTRAALGKKQLTPFLSDESQAVSKKYYVDSRWTNMDNKTYFYPKFPKLNFKRIGKIKEAKQWDEDQMNDGSSFMLPSIDVSGALSSNYLSKEYVLTGVRDVEWALQALAYKCLHQENIDVFFADVINSAQELIFSAREQQLSKVRKVTVIQSIQRMRRFRCKYVQLREAVIRLQRRHRAIRVYSTYTVVYPSRNSNLRLELQEKDESLIPENFEVLICD